jgi:hypothetical protein
VVNMGKLTAIPDTFDLAIDDGFAFECRRQLADGDSVGA